MRAILAIIFSPVYVYLVLGIGAQIFKERFVGFLLESTTDSEMEWSPAWVFQVRLFRVTCE
jgi:hypothetical protein